MMTASCLHRLSSSMRTSLRGGWNLSVAAATFMLLLLGSSWSLTSAERDFNFNDSQVPLLEPKDEPNTHMRTTLTQDPYTEEVSRCHYTDSEIILSLILKSHDWQDLGERKQQRVIEKLSKFFAVPKEYVFMDFATKRDLNEMQKNALRKGNNKSHTNRRLGRVDLMLGCGASYFSMGDPIANQIGAQMKDGSIDNITGQKFGYWIIWRKQPFERLSRNRRQVEGSGEEDDAFDDDYDYDGTEDEDDQPETVTEVPAITTHAHRHHHGKPELTENNLENKPLEEENVAPQIETNEININAAAQSSPESNLLLINKNGNIDEEIVESVSQLESVITKTIENTKNIKEVPEDVVPEITKELETSPMMEELDFKSVPELLDLELYEKTLPMSTSTLSASEEFPSVISTSTGASTIINRNIDFVNESNNSNDVFSPPDDNESITSNAAEVNSIDAVTSTITSAAPSDIFTDDESIDATNIPVDGTISETSFSSPTSSTPQLASDTTASVGALPESSSTSTVPSIAITDYVEPKIENSPPIIKTRLQKITVTSGKSFTYHVPEDIFYDNEDMTNLRLQLTETDGNELKPTSWFQFNAETREIYGLPMENTVSRWTYLLSATDSGNETVTETVEITVQQHRLVRSVNHEIMITAKVNEKHVPNIDWQLKLMSAISSTLGDESPNAMVVREIRQNPHDPNTATFIYFNETLPTAECPEAELNRLVQELNPTRITDIVAPTLSIKSISGQMIGSCQKQHVFKSKPTTPMAKNVPPMPRNQVDLVNATAGHLLLFKVPHDTFYDPNDQELTLTLKTKDHKDIQPKHWLQFDSKNEEFYGIPKGGDVGSEEYLLMAEDSSGLSATDALVVTVNHAPKKDFSVVFKAYLAIPHDKFNANLQRKFVERISALFGDHGTNNVQIRSIVTQHDSDSIIVSFYNTTLYKHHNRCPEAEIEAVRSVYLMQDNSLRDRIKKALGTDLNLTNMHVSNMESCKHPPIDVPPREYTPPKTEKPILKSTFGDDYLYTFVLPAVVIIIMIILASLIACCLHRRRRKSGKMELGNEEERKSFRTKGIPVIFQDELDEKPEIGNKSPIILKDEKPPLLPPSYNTSNMNGDTDVDEYVPPPAVVLGGREVRGKSPATPSYRKPPPYVSP